MEYIRCARSRASGSFRVEEGLGLPLEDRRPREGSLRLTHIELYY